MINNKDYSGQNITYLINIGGLYLPKEKRRISRILDKCVKDIRRPIASYDFSYISHTWVLVVTSPVQYIPELILILAENRIAIYEVKALNDRVVH